MDKLEELRLALQALDGRLIEILAVRARLAERVGEVKKRQGLPLRNKELEKEKIRSLVKLANGRVDEKFIEEVWGVVFQESVRLQKEQEENKRSVGWG